MKLFSVKRKKVHILIEISLNNLSALSLLWVQRSHQSSFTASGVEGATAVWTITFFPSCLVEELSHKLPCSDLAVS